MNFRDTPEFRRIAAAFGWGSDGRGIGDDAAIVGEDRDGLLCCDALVEGVHFRRDWSSPEDVGWKAVVANVADIFAMGGVPTDAVWSVGLGPDWTDEDFAGLARGALEACREHGCRLVGGDTSRTLSGGFVSLSLQGVLRGKRPWLRSGASVGDRLVVSGTLGWSAAGLAALEAGLSGHPHALEFVARHRRPRLHREGFEFHRRGEVHAAIDLSDGLSSECEHLSAASGCAIVLECASLAPVPSQAALASLLGLDPLRWLLDGGEDHSLLLALPGGSAVGPGCLEIGRVEEGEGVWLEAAGKRIRVVSGAWSHI